MPKRIPRYVKTHPKSLLVVLVMAATVLVSYALVSVALTTRAENARKDRVQLCRLQNESNRVLRSILVLARETALGPDQRLTRCSSSSTPEPSS